MKFVLLYSSYNKKIESIANVSFGINHPPDKRGDVSVIQAVSIGRRGVYTPVHNVYVSGAKLSEKNYLSAGDLLFAAKGVKNYPYVVKKEDLPVATSSVFFIISVSRRLIRPEFLAWYLKTPEVRHWIAMVSEGSTIASISIREFRKLRVPVPALKVQKKIIELQELQEQYRKKAEKLVGKVELLNDEISRRLIDKENG